mmetsp:Transcript_11118/g.13995  ORF Transcript_11118/g.13995 Transcript_11118/m.13995 type:complete len:91 (+) Transcript_11118:96-368(+)
MVRRYRKKSTAVPKVAVPEVEVPETPEVPDADELKEAAEKKADKAKEAVEDAAAEAMPGNMKWLMFKVWVADKFSCCLGTPEMPKSGLLG